MGTLYLIRHGQASLGSEDYDRLSDLGLRQCEQLGCWMRERGLQFEAALRGTLRRHRQSFEAIAAQMPGMPEASTWPALDEYDSEAILRAVAPKALPAPTDPEGYRQHFRLLREGLLAWMAGRVHPEGMPTWDDFADGVAQALDHVRSQHTGDVLLVSSGGPISTAVAHVLGAPPSAAAEMNLRLRNSAVTEFTFSPKRHALLSFNTLPHLDHPERRDWVSYA